MKQFILGLIALLVITIGCSKDTDIWNPKKDSIDNVELSDKYFIDGSKHLLNASSSKSNRLPYYNCYGFTNGRLIIPNKPGGRYSNDIYTLNDYEDYNAVVVIYVGNDDSIPNFTVLRDIYWIGRGNEVLEHIGLDTVEGCVETVNVGVAFSIPTFEHNFNYVDFELIEGSGSYPVYDEGSVIKFTAHAPPKWEFWRWNNAIPHPRGGCSNEVLSEESVFFYTVDSDDASTCNGANQPPRVVASAQYRYLPIQGIISNFTARNRFTNVDWSPSGVGDNLTVWRYLHSNGEDIMELALDGTTNELLHARFYKFDGDYLWSGDPEYIFPIYRGGFTHPDNDPSIFEEEEDFVATVLDYIQNNIE